ncbi:MAG: type II toxin-antitoxin system VapC family toxin [bacterium]
MVYRLSQYNQKEQIFIDTSIFIAHFSSDPQIGSECSSFLNKVEKRKIKAFINPLVLNEVSFILLKQKASVILKTDRHYKILETLRSDPILFQESIKSVDLAVKYIQSLTKLNAINICSFDYATFLSAHKLSSQYNLLPRDASYLATMFANNLQNIATTDPDFEKIKDINTWMPYIP